MSRIALSDLPPRYQAQVAAQLGRETSGGDFPPGWAASLIGSAAPPARHGRAPNKTEQAFRDGFFPAGSPVRYEPLTFRLPGGSRYTPDFVEGLTCYEVKGSRRLGSHGRALTAFREARAAFPQFRFRWFEMTGGGVFVEKYPQS